METWETNNVMRMNYVRITPDMAREMLKRNSNNRNINNLTVAQYARDIANGKWTTTGTPISFSSEGELQDGQHRLKAIIKSNIPTDFWVCTGAPNGGVYDIGKKRSTLDILTMRGNVGGHYANSLFRRLAGQCCV